MTTIIVMAKECRPGAVKTRLTPPFTPEEAARIAAASLHDTLAAVSAMPASRRVLCVDGTFESAPPGWELTPQGGGTLDERIAAALDGCRGPTLVLGMDTPQVTAAHLSEPLESWPAEVDAWIGPATDGGYWMLGLRLPDGELVRGIPMSRPDTGARQRQRLVDAGLVVRDLAALTDIDTADSLSEVLGGLRIGALRAEMARIRRDAVGARGVVTGS